MQDQVWCLAGNRRIDVDLDALTQVGATARFKTVAIDAVEGLHYQPIDEYETFHSSYDSLLIHIGQLPRESRFFSVEISEPAFAILAQDHVLIELRPDRPADVLGDCELNAADLAAIVSTRNSGGGYWFQDCDGDDLVGPSDMQCILDGLF